MNTKAYTVEIKNAAVADFFKKIGPGWQQAKEKTSKALLPFFTTAPKAPASSPSGRKFSLLRTLLTLGGIGLFSTAGYNVYKARQEYTGSNLAEVGKLLDSYTRYRKAVSDLYPVLNPALGALVGGIGGIATSELLDKSPTAGLVLGALLGGGLGHYLNTAGASKVAPKPNMAVKTV